MLKTLDITITFNNRDNGARFRIKEMPAIPAERWGRRAIFAMLQGGFPLEKLNVDAEAGMAAIAMVPLEALARMDPELGDPLFDEMLHTCVKALRTDQNMEMDLLPNEPQEIATLLYLRAKVVELHTGFFWVDDILSSIRGSLKMPPAATKDTPTTSTPRPISGG
ncbi:MAG: hypothetical protein JSS57_07355 [Proteobacteria bacterium]|nr:hypothetical protein [Pseudomonadota bacterium]